MNEKRGMHKDRHKDSDVSNETSDLNDDSSGLINNKFNGPRDVERLTETPCNHLIIETTSGTAGLVWDSERAGLLLALRLYYNSKGMRDHSPDDEIKHSCTAISVSRHARTKWLASDDLTAREKGEVGKGESAGKHSTLRKRRWRHGTHIGSPEPQTKGGSPRRAAAEALGVVCVCVHPAAAAAAAGRRDARGGGEGSPHMLPDLQLICHPPSNGGVVWRIDAYANEATGSQGVLSSLSEWVGAFPPNGLTDLQLGPYICRPSFWSTSLTGPGAIPDCDADLSTYYPAAPAHRTAAPQSLQRRPRPPPVLPACYSVTPVRCTRCPLRTARSTHSLLRRTRSLHPLPHSLLLVTIPVVLPPLATLPHLPDPLAALPHHRTTAPNAVLTPLPAASACLSPASPIIFSTESIPPSSLPEVRPFGITRTAGPLFLSFLPPPPSASRHWCPYSRRLVRAFRELLTGGVCADKVSVCSLYRQTASASDAARLLGGKWSGGRPEREGGV
ncbi:hypothetical protein B0H14DRAFT_3727597 [Mycena olivaceomarginata]|nr:hypothetical protein B0H14DRAFT_3727597 [Mycena olivaceomarginata]